MKSFLYLVPLLVLAACGDGANGAKIRQSIVDEFKTTDVVPVPGRSYSFIARTADGDIWYAETMNISDAKVSAKALLFKATKETK